MKRVKSLGKWLAIKSLLKAIYSDASFKKAYRLSLERLPDLKEHYTGARLSDFLEYKVRFLLTAQSSFVADDVAEILQKKEVCTLLDVGDSDGSLQLMVRDLVNQRRLLTCGLNLQKEAVQRIRKRGLKAIRADAMKLASLKRKFDIVTVMETLEHLPNPIDFLQSLHNVVVERLVISVPYVRESKVALDYLNPSVFGDRKPTIENVHIFEFSPSDWEKIFLHSGWRVLREKIAFQYPQWSLLSITKYF